MTLLTKQEIKEIVLEALGEFENKIQQNGNEQDILNIKQASEFLHISVKTLYRYVSKNEVPVNKKYRRLYFSKKELTNWIHTGKKETVGQLEKNAEVIFLNAQRKNVIKKYN